MNIIEAIEKRKRTLFTFEILPPTKGTGIQSVYDTIDPLLEFEPSFIDVTYHREEVSFRELPDGRIEKKILKKRPGTVGISAAIKYKYKVEVVPHIICGGFTREETENGLIDLHFLGIQNLLAVRGDNLPGERSFRTTKGGHEYASGLIRQIRDLNKGIYLDDELEDAIPTNFTIGVAGYPEKHAEAPNLSTDIRYLKEKIDSGAGYIVTQMFFDNRKYFDFVNHCRQEGIHVPIIPGLKPVTTKSQLYSLPRTFNISIPEILQQEMEKCKDSKACRQTGIEWCVEQSKELMQSGVPVLHYFTMGKSQSVREVAARVF